MREEHKTLKTYGVGSDISRDDWFAYFKDLIAQGFLRQSSGEYPTLSFTERSDDVLRGNAQVQLRVIEKVEDGLKIERVSISYDQPLFELLRAKRLELARREDLPPYIIFSDATLTEMAAYFPRTKDEMLNVSGVGDSKFAKYGAGFLAVIADHCAKRGFESRMHLKPRARRSGSKTKRDSNGDDTSTVSYKMFRSGMSVAEIAKARGFVTSTVENHLAKFVETGEMELHELVDPLKVDAIRKAILEADSADALGPIKAMLGETASYGEIRAVLAELARTANQ